MNRGVFPLSWMGLLFLISDLLTSLVWPTFRDMAYSDQASKRDLANIKALRRRIGRCLFLNLSWSVEPVFRTKLHRILISHISNPISDFEKSRAELNRLFSSRNRVALHLIPTDQLVRCLGSVGFFSLRCHSKLQNNFSTTPTLRNLILLMSFRRKFGRRGVNLLAHVSRFESQPKSSIQDFRGVLSYPGPAATLTPNILIVGPGANSFPMVFEDFDEVWWLLTPSTDCQRLAHSMTKGGDHWLFLNNVAAGYATDPSNSHYREPLAMAKGVIAHSQWEHAFQEMSLSTRNFDSSLAESFLSGSPNLLPRAVSLAIRLNAKVVVTGADLYTGKNLYRHETQRELGGKEYSPQLHPFFTCISLSGHNPLSNFNALKLAFSAGFIVGDRGFIEVMNMSAKTYLEHIDYSVGEKRK